jgi:arylsulfatase A-like enzyme
MGLRLLRVCAAVCILSLAGAALRQERILGAAKPNVVLIVLDDMALNDYSVLLAKDQLPAIKGLLDSSYRFTESFQSGSVGSSARVSILSGQYPHNHLEKGADLFFGGPPKHNEATLLPNWLKTAGYVTAKVGRTIPGYGAGDLTAAEFASISAGIPGGLPSTFYSKFPKATYVPPGWDLWEVFIEPFTWSVDKYKTSFNGRKVDFAPVNTPVEQLHQIDMVAWRAANFIGAMGTYPVVPWFIEVAPVTFNRELWPAPSVYNVCADPSDPLAWWFGGSYWGTSQRPPQRYINTIWNAASADGVAAASAAYPFPQPPSFNEADVSDKPRWVQNLSPISDRNIDCVQKRWWRRLEELRAVDEMVGYVMRAVTDSGQAANTYVILTSDNGIGDGQHRYNEKMSAYEESIRTLLLIRPPGGTTAQNIDQMALGIDIAPTIAAIAGATPSIAVDGRSLLPLMAQPSTPWRKMGLLEHTLGVWDSGEASTSPREYWGLRTSSAKPRLFVHYPTVQTGVKGEYYDLAADPQQLSNLFADPAQQTEVAALTAWLTGMKTCKGASCRLYEDSFDR